MVDHVSSGTVIAILVLLFLAWTAVRQMMWNSPQKWMTASSSSSQCPKVYSALELVGLYGGNTHERQYSYESPTFSIRRTGSSSSSATGNSSIFSADALAIPHILLDQALLHIYGFNYVEAQRNLDAAIDYVVSQDGAGRFRGSARRTMSVESDDTQKYELLAMLYFAQAYSHGPNVNLVVAQESAEKGREAIVKAVEICQKWPSLSQSVECDLIRAQRRRFYHQSVSEWLTNGQSVYDAQYVREMALLAKKYPRNAHVQAFYGEAIIDQQPWDYYLKDRRTLKPDIKISMRALGSALDLSKYRNPLALHLHIHVTEAGARPGDGEKAADALAAVVATAGAGHLLHMPGHTYNRVGRYQDCITSSLRAIALDDLYASRCLSPYAPGHNKGLLIMAAMSMGNSSVALEHTVSISETDDAAATYLSALFTTPTELIYARFGWWSSILGLHKRQGNAAKRQIAKKPIYLQAMHQYATALALIGRRWEKKHALVGTGAGAEVLDSSKTELVALPSSQADAAAAMALVKLSELVSQIPADDMAVDHVFYPYHRELGFLMNATAYASYTLQVDNDPTAAISMLNPAVELQASFSYMEPENFYRPLKPCLAAVYLARSKLCVAAVGRRSTCDAAKDAKTAVTLYQSDLKEHPQDIWSLRGLADAYRQADNPSMGDRTERDFLQRIAGAEDRTISGSCCELGLC
jgi:tetratricopeptide (TPR) repeat protein